MGVVERDEGERRDTTAEEAKKAFHIRSNQPLKRNMCGESGLGADGSSV